MTDWRKLMKPLIRRRTPEEVEADEREAKRAAQQQRDLVAFAVLWARMGWGPVAPRHGWRGRLFRVGENPRDAFIAEYRHLREWVYGPVMPLEERAYLGPPPSTAHSRLYEHLRKETALGLATQLRNFNSGLSKTTEGNKEGDNL
jgi:hypothetical protein